MTGLEKLGFTYSRRCGLLPLKDHGCSTECVSVWEAHTKSSTVSLWLLSIHTYVPPYPDIVTCIYNLFLKRDYPKSKSTSKSRISGGCPFLSIRYGCHPSQLGSKGSTYNTINMELWRKNEVTSIKLPLGGKKEARIQYIAFCGPQHRL